MTPRVMVVSASDSRFMPLLRAMLDSTADERAAPGVETACFDLGLSAADRDWLGARDIQCLAPRGHLGIRAEDHRPALLSFLARPFLREYFPGFDVYLWIDSDVWLQDGATFRAYVDGAMRSGMAIAHERERAYRFQFWLFGWTAKHMVLGYGPLEAQYLLRRPHLNAGFFGLRSDAPHWDAWARRYRAAIDRSSALVPHDQFALNQAIHGNWRGGDAPVPATLLDPGQNWICAQGTPMWNDETHGFCKPYAPFETIGAIHLAGPGKTTLYDVARTGGGRFNTYLVRGSSPDTPSLRDPLDLTVPHPGPL